MHRFESSEASARPIVNVAPLPRNYRAAWEEQQARVQQLLKLRADGNEAQVGTLMLGEHDHVYTLGLHAQESNLLVPLQLLEKQGIPLERTNRGGDITYHGPGQLVGYPLLHLPSFGLGARAYIARLESTVIETIGEYGIEGIVDPKAAGVWLRPTAQRPLRKICAIGVHISRSVSMHGFALNVNTDLSYFSRINPCGFTDRGVSSVAQELGHTVDFPEFQSRFLSAFAKHFGVTTARHQE